MNFLIPRENEWEGGVLATLQANYKNRMTYLYCKAFWKPAPSKLAILSFRRTILDIDYIEEGIPSYYHSLSRCSSILIRYRFRYYSLRHMFKLAFGWKKISS